MSDLKKNLVKVINNLEDEDHIDVVVEAVEDVLNIIHAEDGFGTEGQNDPRGDFRDGIFSVKEPGL